MFLQREELEGGDSVSYILLHCHRPLPSYLNFIIFVQEDRHSTFSGVQVSKCRKEGKNIDTARGKTV